MCQLILAKWSGCGLINCTIELYVLNILTYQSHAADVPSGSFHVVGSSGIIGRPLETLVTYGHEYANSVIPCARHPQFWILKHLPSFHLHVV